MSKPNKKYCKETTRNETDLGKISREISSIQMLSFIDESCLRNNRLFPYYFSLVVLSSYIVQVTAPNEDSLSLQAEMIDHENLKTQLRLAAIDQHQKFVRNSGTDKQFEEKRANEKCFKCNICDKQFDYQSWLQQHNLQHKSEKSFKCKLCKKAFRYLYTLKRHEKEHGEERLFLCNQCGKAFKRLNDLKRHKRTHKNEPFKCDECGKLFKYQLQLRKHTDGKLCQLHRCQICNKSFENLSSLKRHEKKHEERTFRCDQYGRGFKERGHLRRHERIHAITSSLQCNECGEEFNRSDYLKSHKITHKSHNPYLHNKKYIPTETDPIASLMTMQTSAIRARNCSKNSSGKSSTGG
ncbi:zinc finger, C2H2 type, partial [Onchocerca flexuosa]